MSSFVMSTPLYNARYTLLVRARVYACVRAYTSGIRRTRNSHRRVPSEARWGGPQTSEREETSRCERRELPNWNVLFHLLFGKREMSSRAERREKERTRRRGRGNRLRHSNGFMRAREKESATSSLGKRLVAFIEKPSSSIAARNVPLNHEKLSILKLSSIYTLKKKQCKITRCLFYIIYNFIIEKYFNIKNIRKW